MPKNFSRQTAYAFQVFASFFPTSACDFFAQNTAEPLGAANSVAASESSSNVDASDGIYEKFVLTGDFFLPGGGVIGVSLVFFLLPIH